ncbi:uncharacterized protein LOC110631535 [Hevea brasiliensis]|uniref:uncharacterized protein LOC110631535 n=1 Tax=Hevea brasiliensis TaxID=3981 RepID=UPI0025D1065B|nr:uncharacterized protein LOC110631535 [Hevea brasiliensis]XP_021635092.2 uncharacterized protein LOC110631535 [Hevea brasiliensis]XP_021635093.2 uncharacterized protein LOC110631535 [Hevea brasiliensis]
MDVRVLFLDQKLFIVDAKVVTDLEFKYNYCVYDSEIATSLGITATVLLLVSQVLTMRWACLFSFCFRKALKHGGCGACALILSIICWITFLAAEGCLLVDSVRNAQHTKYRTIFGQDAPYCQTLRKGVFEAGAALTLLTSLFSKMNYVCCFKHQEGFDTENTELGSYTSI